MAKKAKTLGTKFRPSNADRYLNCPASVVMTQYFPVDDGTVYSETGNVAHALGELCINTGKNPADYLGQRLCADQGIEVEVSADMLDGVELYVNWVRDQGFVDLQTEMQVSLPWIPNAGGLKTTGFIDLKGFVPDFNTLMVVDYKNGVMPVPNNSYQFAFYAYPLLFDNDSKYKDQDSVVTVKIQPNCMEGNTIGSHVWTRSDLIRLKAKTLYTVDWVNHTKPEDVTEANYCEGHWCKFCPYAECPLKAQALFDTVEPEKALPVPSSLTPEKVRMVLEKRSEIKKWLDDVYKFHLANGIRGDTLEGMKIVNGRNKPRSWRKSVSETELIETLVQEGGLSRDKCFQQPKPITPASAKKLLKGKLENIEHVLDPASKTIELVPLDDDRKSIDGEDFF